MKLGLFVEAVGSSLGGYTMRRCLVLLVAIMTLAAVVPVARAQVGDNPYIGEILLVPFNFAPHNWAFCNGQLLPIIQNQALFSLLGTQFGGNGTTNFALPDLRGRSPIGAGQGPGLTPYNVGETGGQETVTLTVNQLPAHDHPAFGSANQATMTNPSGAVWATQTRLTIYSSTTDSTHMAPSGLTGGNQPHDNRAPYLTLNYIISLAGIFPTRN
jgi:microcystin-dependent protein